MKSLLFAILLTASLGANAYIDPVTGSAIVQGLVAGLAFVIVFFKKVKLFIQNAIKKILNRK